MNLKINQNLSTKNTLLLLGDVNSSHLKKWVQALAVDFQVAVFSFNGPDEATLEDLRAVGVVWYCPEQNVKTNKFSYFLHFSRLRSAVQSFQPDIIHAHYASSYGFFGALLKKRPFIVSAWGSDVFEFPRKSFLHKHLLQFVFRRSTLLLSTSKIMAKEMNKYTNQKIEITPFGVCTARFKPEDVHPIQNKFIVGTVKSLEHVYGIDTLIHAFKDFHTQYPNSECHIYGRGSKAVEYLKLIESLGLSEFVFLKGYISNEMVPAALSTFDVFCALSRSESFGVAVLEASSCAVPVVASNIDGLQEVVDADKTGFLVNAMNQHEIVEKLMLLAKHTDQAKEMGAFGRAWVQAHFSWNKSVSIMKTHYDSILKIN